MKPRIRRSTHPDWAWECEGGTITSYGPSIDDAFWTWAWAYARHYNGNVTPT